MVTTMMAALHIRNVIVNVRHVNRVHNVIHAMIIIILWKTMEHNVIANTQTLMDITLMISHITLSNVIPHVAHVAEKVHSQIINALTVL